MARREILDRIQKYIDPFRITKGKGFRLKNFDPGDTCGLQLDKGEAAELLARGTEWLADEQDMLYAQDCWSLLSCFRRWTPPARTVRSSTSCRASILRGARCSRSSSLRGRTSTTISCGATSSACPSAGASGSSTVRITRRCWWCVCTLTSSSARGCPAERRQENLGRTARRYRALRGLPHPTGDDHPQVFFECLAQGAEEALHAASRPAAEALEVLFRRHP